MTTFTSNDLLLYVLNETSSEMNINIEEAMKTNSAIKEEVQTLHSSIQEISTISFSPSQNIMDNIFAKLHLQNDVVVV